MKTNRVLWTVLTVLIVTALMISACGSSATPNRPLLRRLPKRRRQPRRLKRPPPSLPNRLRP